MVAAAGAAGAAGASAFLGGILTFVLGFPEIQFFILFVVFVSFSTMRLARSIDLGLSEAASEGLLAAEAAATTAAIVVPDAALGTAAAAGAKPGKLGDSFCFGGTAGANPGKLALSLLDSLVAASGLEEDEGDDILW